MGQFKLGERVVVSGKFVKVPVDPSVVAQIENAVLNHDITATSKKYKLELFDSVREGIIVGTRSIANTRSHYCQIDELGKKHYLTKTSKKKVFLVATDMRGILYVPEMAIWNSEDYYALTDELDEAEDLLVDDDLDLLEDDFNDDEELF